jgi:hypothetical protein
MASLKTFLLFVVLVTVSACGGSSSKGQDEHNTNDPFESSPTDVDTGSETESADTGDIGSVSTGDSDTEENLGTGTETHSEPADCASTPPDESCAGGLGTVEYNCIGGVWQRTGFCCWTDGAACFFQFQWSDSYEDKPRALAQGAQDGVIYLAGQTRKSNLDPVEMALTKFKRGVAEWTKRYGSPAKSNIVEGIATDSNGNVYLVGSTNESLDGQPNSGGMDVFVMKVDEDGELIWTTLLGNESDEKGYAIALDSEGNVFIAGLSNGSFYGHLFAGDFSDVIVAKLDPKGSLLWTGQFGSSKYDHTTYSKNPAIALDDKGDLYVVGATLGDLAQATLGSHDAYVAKYSASGEQLWIKQFGTDKADSANDIAIVGGDTIIIVGSTEGDLHGHKNSGDQCLTRSCQDIFIVRGDLDGNLDETATRQWGTDANDAAAAVSVAADGSIFLTGHTNGLFASHFINAADIDDHEEDIMVAKLGQDGSQIWTRQYGSDAGLEFGFDVLAAHGEVYVVGKTQGLLGLEHPPFAGADAVLIKMK